MNVVVETVVCLPDAVQALTPCTLGNGFLQVLDWGKFALTIYDRVTLQGARAWVSAEGIEEFPLVADWYLRRAEGKKVEKIEVVKQIMAGGHGLVRSQVVTMKAPLKETEHVPTTACPSCGEYHPSRQGGVSGLRGPGLLLLVSLPRRWCPWGLRHSLPGRRPAGGIRGWPTPGAGQPPGGRPSTPGECTGRSVLPSLG